MELDCVIEDSRWDVAGLEALAQRAAAASLRHLALAPDAFEICVMGCDDARIAVLNGDFRDKPQATNVLSWPSEERGADVAGGRPDLPDPGELGDIAIAFDTCQREAAEQGKTFEAHVTHLLVHATLHLLGYDHIDDQDAVMMEQIEVEILATLGLGDPY